MPLLRRRRPDSKPERIKSGLPLSPNEERYVLSEVMATQTYGNPWTVRLRGRLDEPRFRDALQQLCDRHEARRTGFEASDDGRFTRYVEARGRPEVTWISMPGASDAQLRQAVRRWCLTRGDLSPPSFSRFLLIKVSKQDHLFGHYFHHSTNDGETHRAAVQEIFAAYSGLEVPPPPGQYGDLWNWDWAGSPAYREAEAYWAQKFTDVASVGALPEDGGDAETTLGEGPVCVTLPATLVAKAREAAKRIGTSEFALYYAVTQVLLTRLTGEPRVCSTFQSSGRRTAPGSAGVHGVFSNGLLLATKVDEAESISTLALRLRDEIRGALAHEIYPYHHIVRASGLHPRFGINWFPEPPILTAPGLEISRTQMDYGAWEFDLNLRFVPDSQTDSVDLVIFFREAVFQRGRVEAIATQFTALLDRLSRDELAPLSAIRSATFAEPGLLPDPNAMLPDGGGELLQAAFLRQVQLTPDRIALVQGPATFTYAEVERRACQVACELKTAGVSPGDRVAIVAERGPELVWTMLGAARFGAVFAILDSAYPVSRLAELLTICAPSAIVPAGDSSIEGLARQLADKASLRLIKAGAAGEDLDRSSLDRAAPCDPAYILFTSGSTGMPKGVCCSHAPLSRFVAWHASRFDLTADDQFSMLSGLSHDPLLRDVFAPLSLGARLEIPDSKAIAEPGALLDWFRKSGVSVTHITPAMGRLLVAGRKGTPRLPQLRRVFWGGDKLPPDLVQAVRDLSASVEQVNFYGATETPQAVAVHACADDNGGNAVPIGKGANGAQLLVVDAGKRLLGIGELGEIAVRSNHLCLGELNHEGLIVPLTPQHPNDAAIYCTGDYGFYLPSGDVLLLGRLDDQIKIRGYRVALGEVTAALKREDAVSDAITLPVGEGLDRRIEAFVTLKRGAKATGVQLLASLSRRLPAHMLPRTVRILTHLPLLPNGKVDRQALQAQTDAKDEAATTLSFPPAVNDRERAIITAWSAILGDADISPATTFSALGGDSLTYVQAYLAVESVIGHVPDAWPAKSIAELASQPAKSGEFWTTIESTMLIRAVAIVLVVVGHMNVLAYGGGATAALLIVSGFLFARLALGESLRQNSAKSVLDSFWRLVIPTLVFSIGLFAAKVIAGRHPALGVLFLTENLHDYSKLSGPNGAGHEMHLWFIHCMIQMFGILYLGLLALKRLGAFRHGPRRIALLFFLLGCIGRFAAPALLIPGFFEQAARHMTPFVYLPTTHLSTLMLGALIAFAETRRARWAVFLLLLGYCALSAATYGETQSAMILVAGSVIFFAPRLPLPRPLTALALSLSGASLFIYLTHFPIRTAMRLVGAPEWPLVHVVVALVGGVLAWAGWTLLKPLALRLLRRAPSGDPAGAI